MLQKFFKVTLKKLPCELDSNVCEVGIEDTIIKNHNIILTGHSKTENATSFIGAIIKDFPNLHQPFTCKFVQVKILETVGDHKSHDVIPLFVSDNFLKLYSMSYDELCYFKAVTCYPVDKVLLGAKTSQSLELFQNPKKFSALADLIAKDEVLCCQGDFPLMPSQEYDNLSLDDFIVLDCQPFRQGMVSLKSSVVLADMHEDIAGAVTTHNKAESNILDKTSMIDLISYTSNNFLSNPISEGPRLSSSALSLMKAVILFEIQIIPKLNADFEKELLNLDKNLDPLNTVFISSYPQTFFKVKSGDWVEISLLPSEYIDAQSPGIQLEPNQTTRRLAHICIVSNKNLISKYFQSPNAAYISPLVWFNLNRHPSLLIQPDTRLQIKPLEANFAPPYAKEAFACLIQSPNYDGKVDCKALMKKYFSLPRFVCKGDIFALNSKGQLDFHSKILDEDIDKLKWPVVYFRVSSVSGIGTPFGHLISSYHTLLYQSGTKQSYVPVTMETYYQLSSYHPLWNGVPNGLSQYIEELQAIILPFLSLRKKNQVSSNFLFTGPPCCGKTTVVKAVCKCLNLHLYQINCHEFAGDSSTTVENKIKTKIFKGTIYAPCVILLKNVHTIGIEREGTTEDSRVIYALADTLKEVSSFSSEHPLLVIGTASDPKQLSNNLVSSFLHSIQMTAPNEEERCLILEDLLTACDVGNDVSVRYLAQRTAGFVLGDLTALINQSIKNSYNRIDKFVEENKVKKKGEEDIVLASVPVIQKDLVNALEMLQSEFADAIGAPKIPNVKFEDVGGLARVKQEILDTIQLPLEHPEILTSGLRRSGVLLYGPPGSGKTLLAKAVATECSLNFLSVKGPELINMYVGQSEENVRAVFNQARSAVPCIIFFDELDSLAPNRGRSGDSGGVMDRVVSQLLAELDGLNKKSEVFVIGATNRPDLIDPALLRPGRFDHLLYVGIPEDHRSKLSILKALTRKFPLAPDVNLSEIVKKCPPHLSGADFYSLCSNAVIQRMEKNVELIEEGGEKIEDLCCEVSTEDFLSALSTLVPSVTPEQYMEYLAIKAKIEQE